MIVPMVKVSIYGFVKEKEQILAELQEMGCLHLVPLKPPTEAGLGGGPSPGARDALKFLLSCPQKRRQVKDPSKFDAVAVERQALDLQKRIQDLRDELDFLQGRIENLRLWGDFAFPPREDLGNYRLWFYIVPHNQMKDVEATDLIWEVVRRDNRFSYVAVISEKEPQGMPVQRTRTGDKPLSELEQRLDEVELELEDLEAERSSLTRWCYLFARSLDRLEDTAARTEAATMTYDDEPLFGLHAWALGENVDRLQEYASDKGLALEVQEPEPEETPPTLLRSPPTVAAAQNLISFYMTPRYWLWDPSAIVFFAFAVFFAMILADAGYSLVLGLGLALGWKGMGQTEMGRRFRILLAALVGAGVIYGVLVGSYFGVAPGKHTLLAKFNIIHMTDFDLMMMLSIMTGVLHLILANAVTAWHRRHSIAAVEPVGWVFIFLGGVAIWLGVSGGEAMAFLKTAGTAAIGLGAAAVLLFSSVEGPLWRRLLRGLQGLTRISSAFGDSLSYLRLFALGLASASLASTFNDLAGQVKAALPAFGIFFAILIVLLGHGLNFVLALTSGLIHGLRLNFIEFFKWSISEEGHPFKAFARKESE